MNLDESVGPGKEAVAHEDEKQKEQDPCNLLFPLEGSLFYLFEKVAL